MDEVPAWVALPSGLAGLLDVDAPYVTTIQADAFKQGPGAGAFATAEFEHGPMGLFDESWEVVAYVVVVAPGSRVAAQCFHGGHGGQQVFFSAPSVVQQQRPGRLRDCSHREARFFRSLARQPVVGVPQRWIAWQPP